MSDERVRRVVHNEVLFRQVNETIDQLNDNEMAHGAGEFAVVCECGDLGCTDQIPVDKAAYERTRSNPVWFLVKSGHEIPAVEHVVASGAGYLIVEKDPPDARAFAQDTAP